MRRSLPDRCRCGSQRMHSIPQSDIRTMAYAGTLPDGYEFSAIQWERKRCDECGQALAIRTFLP